MCGTVFIAKKKGGSDDGKLYALKIVYVEKAIERDGPDVLKSLVKERDVTIISF